MKDEAMKDDPKLLRLTQYTTRVATYEGMLTVLARALERKVEE